MILVGLAATTDGRELRYCHTRRRISTERREWMRRWLNGASAEADGNGHRQDQTKQ
jgi:hypothetical protein